MRSKSHDIKVSDNVVVRDGRRLISVITAEKSSSNIDYLWFAPYKGGTQGFDFNSGVTPITSNKVSSIEFGDWKLNIPNDKFEFEVLAGKYGSYKLSCINMVTHGMRGVFTTIYKLNDNIYARWRIPFDEMRRLPAVCSDVHLSYGIPSQQFSVIYRGNLFIGKCFVFLLGGFAVLLTDDLCFDALCLVTGVRNLASRGYVLKIAEILMSPNPYIIQMMMFHRNDEEPEGFEVRE